jgi:hypothetical protein
LAVARQPQTNLILTPHTAAGTDADAAVARSEDYDNLVRVLRGQELVGRLI